MTSPFVSQSFVTNDVITKDSLDQMQSNLQWLKDNIPRGRYNYNTGYTDENAVILCGQVKIGKSKKESVVRKRIRFGKAFAPNCTPNVTFGICSDSTREIFCVINGINGAGFPDGTGFDLVVAVPDDDRKKAWQIKKPFYIQWQAFGYRAEDMNDF